MLKVNEKIFQKCIYGNLGWMLGHKTICVCTGDVIGIRSVHWYWILAQFPLASFSQDMLMKIQEENQSESNSLSISSK